MSKKILLIEADAPFAEELTSALEAHGLDVRATGDGRDGFELAKEWGPDAIVLCVELPGMSGYVICQKLKKDEGLKPIPLVITSAEATPETFEKHKTLKVRAEDYLLKPFTGTALLASLGSLIELPEPTGEEPEADAPAEGEEELVALEEEAGIEALGGEPLGGSDLPALDLGSLPDDGPAGGGGTGLDDDLKLLDEAFEGLSTPGAAPRATAPRIVPPAPRRAPAALDLDMGDEAPVAAADVDAAAASIPEEDEGAARAALGRLDIGADDALSALGGPEADEPRAGGEDLERDLMGGLGPDLGLGGGLESEPEPEPELERNEPPPSRQTMRMSAEALRGTRAAERPAAAGGADASRLEREAARKDQKLRELEDRLRDLEDRLSETERRADEAESRAEAAEKRAAEGSSRLAAAESQAAAAKSRLDSTLAQTKRMEAEVKAARQRIEKAEAAAEAAGEAQERAEALERELDELKTDLVVARGEAEGAREEVEKRTAELKKQVQDLQAQASKNEERVVKAYLKIKNDEKVREKTKKALQIAAQLLEEGAPSDEKTRSAVSAAAAALGREQ
jgi:CheY-like chemotaxis protein